VTIEAVVSALSIAGAKRYYTSIARYDEAIPYLHILQYSCV
jgi:hypothetical protein